MLFEMCADEGDELQLDVHMPRSQSTDKGGSGCGMRQLWMQRMRFERLRAMYECGLLVGGPSQCITICPP
jgi:hypothetical protein